LVVVWFFVVSKIGWGQTGVVFLENAGAGAGNGAGNRGAVTGMGIPFGRTVHTLTSLLNLLLRRPEGDPLPLQGGSRS
jgi:hypothetical protein